MTDDRIPLSCLFRSHIKQGPHWPINTTAQSSSDQSYGSGRRSIGAKTRPYRARPCVKRSARDNDVRSRPALLPLPIAQVHIQSTAAFSQQRWFTTAWRAAHSALDVYQRPNDDLRRRRPARVGRRAVFSRPGRHPSMLHQTLFR